MSAARASFESSSSAQASKSNGFSKVARKIVSAAKEHHRKSQEAFDVFYGVKSYGQVKKTGVAGLD